MPDLPARVHLVRNLSRNKAFEALSSALRVCGEAERDGIARGMLGLLRGRSGRKLAPRALVETARAWRDLTPETRRQWREIAGDNLAQAVENLAGSGSEADRAAAADLLSGLDGPAALSDDAVRALLADPRREVSGKAAAVLATTAALDSRPNEHIDSLLAAAARSFPTHRKRAVLEAVLARLDTPSGPLRAWLREPDQPAVLALRAALRTDRDPATRGAAVRLLDEPALASAALARLARPASAEDHEASLARSHLLRKSARRRALRSVRGVEALLPDEDKFPALSPDARRGLAAWIDAAGLGADAGRVACFLATDDILARHAATRAATRALHDAKDPEARERAAGLLCDFALAHADRAAGSAAVALLADAGASRLLPRATRDAMQKSPAPLARAAADLALRDNDPTRSPVAARLLFAESPKRCVAMLRDAVAQGDAGHSVAAMGVARRLGVAPRIELELLAAARSADPRVVATAAMTLGDVETDSARAALALLASHHDARVRANAIEAIGAKAPTDSIVEVKLADPSHRARANAVRALLRDGATRRRGAAALLEMLREADDGRRLSALWVVERACLTEAAPTVARLLRSGDASEHLRWRAGRCARRLLAQMRSAPVNPSRKGAA